MVSSPPRLILIGGPTASGKTGLALHLAESFGGEIISADSMQVYRYLDIGTAKPTPQERARAPHHLIDVVEPDEPFTAGRFREAALVADRMVRQRGRVAIVCGGTGLYQRALTRGIFEVPPIDPAIRARLVADLAGRGTEAMHQRLATVDPTAAARIAPRDRQRILRALEVYEQTGTAISVHQARHRFAERPFRCLALAIGWERSALYERIARRTAEMFQQGLVEEVRSVLARGFSPTLKPMQALGYRQVCALLEGRITEAEAHDQVVLETRRYAKRQLTWFRADQDIHWLSPPTAEQEAHDLVARFLD